MKAVNTKEKIKNALIMLMHDKFLTEIQVKDIVGEAKIARSSFYRNYDSIMDVLDEIETDYFKGFRECNRDCLRTQIRDMETADPYILASLKYQKENADIMLALSGPHGDPRFKEGVSQMLGEFFLGRMAYNHVKMEHSDFYSVFVCSGHIDVIRYWLSERQDISDEEMAVIIAKLMYGYFYI